MSRSNNIKIQEVEKCIKYLESNLPAEEAIVIPLNIFQHIKETIILMEEETAYSKKDNN